MTDSCLDGEGVATAGPEGRLNPQMKDKEESVMTSPSEEGIEVVVEEVEWIDPTPPKRARRTRPTPPAPHASIPVLIENAVQEVKSYFESQLEVLKLKAKRTASQAAASIVMIVAAVLFALLLLWWTFHTAEVALALVVPAWAAALIVWGILLLLVIIFAAIGAIMALGAKNDAPNPKEMVEDDIQTLKSDLTQAKEGLDK